MTTWWFVTVAECADSGWRPALVSILVVGVVSVPEIGRMPRRKMATALSL